MFVAVFNQQICAPQNKCEITDYNDLLMLAQRRLPPGKLNEIKTKPPNTNVPVQIHSIWFLLQHILIVHTLEIAIN